MAWEGQNITNLSQLKKGDRFEITGRLRNQRYTDAEGTEHSMIEVLAQTITHIADPLTMEI